MLTEQLGVGIAEAFIRLRGYAYVNDIGLPDVARDMVRAACGWFPTLSRLSE